MDSEIFVTGSVSQPRTVTLLTGNELLGHLFRQFLGDGSQWRIECRLPSQAPAAHHSLCLLDVASVEFEALSPLLLQLLARTSTALVNVSVPQARSLLERHPEINGVFFNHTTREQLLAGIAALLEGQTWLPRFLMEHLLGQWRALRREHTDRAGLTERERQILEWVAKGLSNMEIAEQLCLSPHTIKSHVHNLLGKLGAANRAEAVSLLHGRGRG